MGKLLMHKIKKDSEESLLFSNPFETLLLLCFYLSWASVFHNCPRKRRPAGL